MILAAGKITKSAKLTAAKFQRQNLFHHEGKLK